MLPAYVDTGALAHEHDAIQGVLDAMNDADLEALLRDMNRVGRGNHNNGVICTPDKLRQIIRLVREYTHNGKIHWKELAEDHFPGEVNVIRNVFRRWLTAARLKFPNANTGTSISRCSKPSTASTWGAAPGLRRRACETGAGGSPKYTTSASYR